MIYLRIEQVEDHQWMLTETHIYITIDFAALYYHYEWRLSEGFHWDFNLF